MPRKGRRPPRRPEPLPPPLPPEERSVGQLVAETIRFYQHHFFQTIPLGLSVAALTQLTVPFGHHRTEPYGHPPPKDFDDRPFDPRRGRGGDHPARRAAPDGVVHRRDRARHRDAPAGSGARRSPYGLGVLVFLPVPLLAQLLVLPAVLVPGLLRLGGAGGARRTHRVRPELPPLGAAGPRGLHPRRWRSRHPRDRLLRRPPDARLPAAERGRGDRACGRPPVRSRPLADAVRRLGDPVPRPGGAPAGEEQ